MKKNVRHRASFNVDNPGENSEKVKDDLFLNPWWGLVFQAEKGRRFCAAMTETLGPPDLWKDGFYRLLWGPRDLHITWRPQVYVNLSSMNSETWFKLWLPWRSQYEDVRHTFDGKVYPAHGHHGLPNSFGEGLPHAHLCEVLDKNLDESRDYNGLKAYAKMLGVEMPEGYLNLSTVPPLPNKGARKPTLPQGNDIDIDFLAGKVAALIQSETPLGMKFPKPFPNYDEDPGFGPHVSDADNYRTR